MHSGRMLAWPFTLIWRLGNEDELLARVLVTSWTLATGRTLRTGVPPPSHSADELISSWADEQIAIP
jgi:hypothetical protein